MEDGSLAALLGAPCRVRDVRVGEVAGVYVDRDATRVIGLDIRSPGNTRRFLPWVVAVRENGGVAARSAFHLLDAGDTYTELGAKEIVDEDVLATLRAGSDGVLVGDDAVSTSETVGTRLA